jgi:hypothetical protein
MWSGRVFTWAAFYKPKYFGYFIQSEVACVLILTENGWGYILGDFFTNSSGHPARGNHTAYTSLQQM